MTRDEIVNKIDCLHKEICKMLDKNKYNTRKCKQLIKEEKALLVELDVIDNKVYNDDEWITKKTFTSTKSLADARLQLSKMLCGLNGVSVVEKSDVQIVIVITKWKEYTFEIHAHHEIEQLEFGYEENPFTKKMQKVCTKQRQVYTAYVEKTDGGRYWNWRY